MFSKKATKFENIFTVDLTLCSNCLIDGEDFVNFCALLRKYDFYAYTDRNFVGSVLTLSTTAAFQSTTLESLVLDWEGK